MDGRIKREPVWMQAGSNAWLRVEAVGNHRLYPARWLIN
jgi:hypothetical protein